MSKINELQKWLYSYVNQFGCNPKVILVTKSELRDVKHESGTMMNYAVRNDLPNQIFGIDAHHTGYATEMRARQLSFPLVQISQDWMQDGFSMTLERHENDVRRTMVERLIAHVASEVTHLDVTIECDPWRWIKKLVSKLIRRPIPIRRTIVRIDGRVLYPSLNVVLPHERHVVKLQEVRR